VEKGQSYWCGICNDLHSIISNQKTFTDHLPWLGIAQNPKDRHEDDKDRVSLFTKLLENYERGWNSQRAEITVEKKKRIQLQVILCWTCQKTEDPTGTLNEQGGRKAI
jgi:hypothetical protein